MNELLTISQNGTVTTIQLRKMINEARATLGEPKVANRHFLARVEDELEGEISGSKIFTPAQGGTPMRYYNLTLEQCMLVGMRESKSVRRKVLDKLKELEARTKPAIPDFSNPAEAARAWANEYEQRLLVERQRDDAIRTKAEIGSRREATSMATASAATRKANALQVQLDKSKEYSSIKRMETTYPSLKFNWRELKAASNSLEKDIIKIADQNYGSVNAYHAEVWAFVYGLDIQE